MPLIILIPAVVCWLALAKGSVRQALLDVYLPVVLLLPQYYVLRLRHLPPLTFADTAILPLGLALVLTEMRHWRLSWMDLWVFLFAVCTGLSEGLSTQLASGQWIHMFSARYTTWNTLDINLADGGLMFFERLMTVVLPYMAGKLLIEQGPGGGDLMRRKLVSRVVKLLAVVAAISVYDFLKGGSIWQKVGGHILTHQYVPWIPQMRWGFGRIAGPYGHAILAGMIFLTGLVYCLWLRQVDPGWGTRRVIAGLPVTVRGVLLAAVVAGLLMTQSRGPWMGVVLALMFMLLTRVLSVGKAAVVFLLFLTLFGAAAYRIGNGYTDVPLNQAKNIEQRNAIYRRQLLVNYIPLVIERKMFGWGITTYPVLQGQVSIDNEYLLLAITQGFAGLGMFLAILAASAWRLMRMIAQPLRQEDRLLVFAHLAVVIGLVTTLATVYMGEQVVIMFFLCMGWVQGMNPVPVAVGAAHEFRPQAGFRRVLV